MEENKSIYIYNTLFIICMNRIIQCAKLPMHIKQLTNRHLLHNPLHPLTLLSNRIQKHFKTIYPPYNIFTDLNPVVTIKQCFDDLNIPSDHVSRRDTDTFYLDDQYLLRTHTSAHQTELLRKGIDSFLVIGDVYRKDEIDSKHYPCFHQVEGVKLLENYTKKDVSDHLKSTLESLIRDIFGNSIQIRWVSAYFPFTYPSYEMEVYYNNDWMEILGCGVIHDKILHNSNVDCIKSPGWAFGLGLERWAMSLYDIKDIRLFWSKDDRFIEQFKDKGLSTKFREYSLSPPCTKDISLWLGDRFNENEFYNIVRETGGDIIEKVQLVDTFTNKKKQKTSKCFRITYRHMERSLTNEETNSIQQKIRESAVQKLNCELR